MNLNSLNVLLEFPKISDSPFHSSDFYVLICKDHIESSLDLSYSIKIMFEILWLFHFNREIFNIPKMSTVILGIVKKISVETTVEVTRFDCKIL